MRRSLFKAAALAGVALLSLSAADAKGSKGTLIAVPEFTGGSSTYPFAINNSDNIAGSYLDASSVQHGFYGTLAGSYTSFDYTGTGVSATQARGMDDNGNITGYAPASGEVVGFEWQLANGAMFTITGGKKGAALDGIAQQINASGDFAGDYQGKVDRYAYIGNTWALQTTLPLEFSSTEMAGRGIDSAGDVVGWFYDANSVQHGFTDMGGTFTQVDYPGNNISYTVLEGINDSGLITGQYEDTSGIIHGFTLDSKGTFKEITVPGSTSFVQAFGLNNAGFVAVVSDAGAFVLCPLKKAKCKKLGATVDVAESRPIHEPTGYFVVFNPEKVVRHGALPVKHLPKGAAAQ
jgi:hypothetical protein